MESRYCDVACMMTALKDKGCVYSGGHAFAETQPAQAVSFGRSLVGRKLVNVASEFGFLNRGLTSACFQVSGKLPVCRERLITLLTTGKSTSRHSTTRGVDIGSKLQDFLLDFPIRHLISSSARGENELSGVEHMVSLLQR